VTVLGAVGLVALAVVVGLYASRKREISGVQARS